MFKYNDKKNFEKKATKSISTRLILVFLILTIAFICYLYFAEDISLALME